MLPIVGLSRVQPDRRYTVVHGFYKKVRNLLPKHLLAIHTGYPHQNSSRHYHAQQLHTDELSFILLITTHAPDRQAQYRRRPSPRHH